MATAGAISLSVAVSPGKTLSIPGSLAVNKNAASNPSPATKASISNIRGTAIKSVNATAIEGADANAYAGNPDKRTFWIESANDLSGEGEVIELFCNDCEEGVAGFATGSRPTIPAVEEMLAAGKISKIEWLD